MVRLRSCPVERALFEPLVCAILQLRPPKLPQPRKSNDFSALMMNNSSRQAKPRLIGKH